MTENVEYDPLILADLRAELLKIENKNGKTIIVGNRKYSVNDALDEISRKSEFGMEIYRMHVGVKYSDIPKSPKSLTLKDISFNVRVEAEAKRLGIERNL